MKKFDTLRKVFFLLFTLMALSYSADAQTRTWIGGATGTWSDAANWNGTVPGSNDTALFNSGDVAVTIDANTTVKILDIRANVTLDIGGNTLTVVANSNPVRPDGHTLEIASGTLTVTPGSATGDAFQFRNDGGKFVVAAGATVNVASGDQGFTSKSDASNGEINNDGVINFDMVTSGKAIELNGNHPLTLVNGKCAVINLGENRILTSLAAASTITNNGLVNFEPAAGVNSGGVLLRVGSTATNNGFFDYSNSANFATGSGGIGTLTDNGVELNPAVSIDAGATCEIDLSSTASGMEAYDWAFDGTTIATNGADGTLDLTGADFPDAAGPHTLTVVGCPEYTISIDVTNVCLEAVLPVELVSFNGKEKGNVNILEWTTASEVNNDFFEVQRSTDGVDFETLESIRGNGTSHTVSHYSFIDEKPASISYYRLQQVDFDGRSEFSNIVTIKRDLIKDDAKVFPSPVQDQLTISYQANTNKALTMSITDVTGRVVINKSVNAVKGNNEFYLDLANLPTGTYMTRLSSGTENISQVIIKM